MKEILLLLGIALILGGCDDMRSEIETGYVSNRTNEWIKFESPEKTELSAQQTRSLNSWFAIHAKRWKTKYTSTPPGKLIYLVHQNGKTTMMNLLEEQLWIGDKYLSLTEQELAELKSILKIQ